MAGWAEHLCDEMLRELSVFCLQNRELGVNLMSGFLWRD